MISNEAGTMAMTSVVVSNAEPIIIWMSARRRPGGYRGLASALGRGPGALRPLVSRSRPSRRTRVCALSSRWRSQEGIPP